MNFLNRMFGLVSVIFTINEFNRRLRHVHLNRQHVHIRVHSLFLHMLHRKNNRTVHTDVKGNAFTDLVF